MKKSKNIVLLLLIIFQVSCVNDPWDEIAEGDWNNERSVLDLKFENQVGQAEIERDDEKSGSITITINVDAVPDLSAIALSSLQLSYGATSTLKVGESLNFENENQIASFTVTSPTGKSREYSVKVTSFQETILGTYEITDLVVYGGTGPEYGGGGVIPMMNKPWIWSATDGPGAELDNTLTFELEGITEEGNTYGKIVNNAGPDGLYANFIFVGDPETDVNNFYRKIPKGEGTWLRNYATGQVIFTFADGKTSSGTMIGAGTEDLGNGKSKSTTSQALVFNLSGTDDWNKIYSDYDKFVKRPRKFWIDLQKQ
ncbi:MAG TPA: hypothetical protein VIQ51_14635 [Chryseosolibacter sp.]